MHPTKAKMLASIDASSASADWAVRHSFRVLASPREHGPVRIGFALAAFPLWAVSAVLGDLSYVIISHTSDDGWDRIRPRASRSE